MKGEVREVGEEKGDLVKREGREKEKRGEESREETRGVRIGEEGRGGERRPSEGRREWRPQVEDINILPEPSIVGSRVSLSSPTRFHNSRKKGILALLWYKIQRSFEGRGSFFLL